MLSRTLALVRKRLSRSRRRQRSGQRRRSVPLRVENLETRRLLAATDLGAIAGVVFFDEADPGYDDGEGLLLATVLLYQDDGDGNFEPGAGDTLIKQTQTDVDGNYRFDGLSAGTYFVRQPAQTADGVAIDDVWSGAIVITAVEAEGIPGVVLDSFGTVPQSVNALWAGGTNPDFNSKTVPGDHALGGERDLFAHLTDGIGQVSLDVLAFDVPVLQFDSTSGVAGRRVVTWDGPDGDGETLDPTGLVDFDLTEGGNNVGFELTMGADQDDGYVELRVYTDATHWSWARAMIPNTGGLAEGTVLIEFDDFQEAGADGGADMTKAGAVQLEITNDSLSVNGRLDRIGALGHTVKPYNFGNTPVVDLELSKTVDNPRPNLFDEVTFTITVANDGPNDATGVAIADVLPAGLTFVRPIADRGAYDDGTGVWTVGNLNVGEQVSLQLVATVDTVGEKINTAQVSAADQVDIDSTPANDDPTEDDQDNARVIPRMADLSVTKTVDNATPRLGEIIVFTVELHNAGPDPAHNVTVYDVLPDGLSYDSANVGRGTYDPVAGIWDIGTVAVDQTPMIRIRAEVTEASPQTNEARVETADEYDPDSEPGNDDPTEDDQDSASITPEIADLSVVKTVDNAGPHVGESVTFTITVHNAGPDPATHVSLDDALPAGLTYQSYTSGRGVYDSGTGEWRLGSLAVDESVTLTVTARVDTGGEKTNTVQVAAAAQYDPDSTPGNNVPTEDDQDDAIVEPLASIAGYVYEDKNANGRKDSGEPGIEGVALQLTGNDHEGNPVDRMEITDADGYYFFGSLPPSDAFGYHIVETHPPEYLDGQESVGNLGGQVGTAGGPGVIRPAFLGLVSPAAVGDSIGQIVLASGQNGVLYNFGEVLTSSIAGRVYYDTNRDGVWQNREAGIPGVTIVLSGFDDLGNPVQKTATTDAQGRYRFDNLRPALSDSPSSAALANLSMQPGAPSPAAVAGYSLLESQPAGYTDGQEAAGTPNLNAQVADDAFSALELGSGVDAIEFNFGEILTVISKRRFLASSG